MRRVSELYGRHAGEDIYVVGSGASVRVLPPSCFDGKVTIALNMAWRNLPARYAVTIHPDLNIPEFIGESALKGTTWIVPFEKTRQLLGPDQFAYAEQHFYGFAYQGRPNTQPAHQPGDQGRVLDWVRRASGDNLYVWSSIAQTGVNLAANLGAKNIVLVGCDNAALIGNHHAHRQHTRWKGVAPRERYRQYYEGMAEVREALRARGVNPVSLQPFLGLADVEDDFRRLCRELDKPELISGPDLSPQSGRAPTLRRRLRALLERVPPNWLPLRR